MIKKAILLMCFAGAGVNAQTITQTFGSGANAFSIDFVQIGNPGNAPDTTGNPNPAGSVEYIYNMGKYEISRVYIDKAVNSGALNITMKDMSSYPGANGDSRPATGISWYEAARFVNWLNTSKGYFKAYKFDENGNYQTWSNGEQGFNLNNPYRNTGAMYVIPNVDEWYKAAYGSPSNEWYNYPNGSNILPPDISSGTSGAVYYSAGRGGPADIFNAGSLSAWGTMGQGGNVWEWTETAFDGPNDSPNETRILRGGSWAYNLNYLESSALISEAPQMQNEDYGFRIVMLPEPSALSLLAIGLGGLAMMRRRRS